MSTVLIAEDDKPIRDALDRILRFEGYETITVNDGAAALEAISEQRPDAVLLDVMMPYVDGLSVARKVRERGDRTPILMLTARQETPDRVAGLDAGADDYLSKPFELEELLARVRALLRRSDTSDSVVLRCGGLLLDPAKHLVSREGHPVELTRTEFEILHTLMTNVEIVMSRSQLYESIWGYDFETNSKSLDVHIGYLRRKLEADGAPRIVHTVRGIGYVVRPAGDA